MEKLKQIYTLIYKQLENLPRFQEEINYYRTVDYRKWENNDFFKHLVRAIFTGIRNDVIMERWSAITKAFSNFDIHRVAKYTEKDVKRLMKNKKIIRYEGKIKAAVSNAKKMEEIIKEYGSFVNYINSFEKPDELIEKLQEGFDFIGEINVYEFAKEIGLPFIKPDKQITRVFLRLALIDEKATPKEILEIGKEIAQTMNERPCVVDCVLWTFGREICGRKPICETCNLTALCQFYPTIPSSL